MDKEFVDKEFVAQSRSTHASYLHIIVHVWCIILLPYVCMCPHVCMCVCGFHMCVCVYVYAYFPLHMCTCTLRTNHYVPYVPIITYLTYQSLRTLRTNHYVWTGSLCRSGPAGARLHRLQQSPCRSRYDYTNYHTHYAYMLLCLLYYTYYASCAY